MTEQKPPEALSEKDRLTTRPAGPLPAVQDPQVHGNPVDPKPVAEGGQGEDPHAGDLGHSV